MPRKNGWPAPPPGETGHQPPHYKLTASSVIGARCTRCRRPLHAPVSLRRRRGPVCHRCEAVTA